MGVIEHFAKLILNPEALPKINWTVAIAWSSLIVRAAKIMTSSAYMLH
jgi:hypothetical protein